MPIAIASRSCSSASAGPSVSTTDSPPFASTIRTASSTPHSSCGLIGEAEVPRLDRERVLGEDDRAAGHRHPLDADEDLHERILAFSGSKSGSRPTTATVTGKRSFMYSTASVVRSLDRVLGRQVGHQDVLAERGPGPSARHVRAAALRVGERRAVAQRDRLAAERVALDAGGRRVIVDRSVQRIAAGSSSR